MISKIEKHFTLIIKEKGEEEKISKIKSRDITGFPRWH